MTSLLPSEGVCQGSYLLAYAAGLDEPPTFGEWIARVSRLRSGHGHCQDLAGLARALEISGVAVLMDGRVRFIPRFPNCRTGANRQTKVRIAALLLDYQRPIWLPQSGNLDQIVSALIPKDDMRALSWLGEDLRNVLAGLLVPEGKDETASKLGEIGELIILASERNRGRAAVRVSAISDGYGYDVESRSDVDVLRIEAKCTFESRAGTFHLSRHEFNQGLKYPGEWKLVQVILAADAVWNCEMLGASAIIGARTVSVGAIVAEIVQDRPRCEWQDSVFFRLPAEQWDEYPLCIRSDWQLTNPLRHST